MIPGSYIVDISIDQGGNCALTEAGITKVVDNVTINGTKNIPGTVPTSSTYMFSENIYNLVKYIIKDNAINLDLKDEIISSVLVTHNKKLLHRGTIEAMEE